jgi:GH25 family lysozyme M1 (1,4-beta-N-acetylmuramidase)
MSAPRRRWRRIAAAAVTASAGMVLLGTLSPADAAPKTIDGMPIGQYIATHDHPMGSQIRRVEGDGSTPDRAEARQPQGRDSDDLAATATVPGIDVSGYQGDVDWNGYWGQGIRFAYVQGDRKHEVYESVFRAAVQRLLQHGHDPWRVSFRDSGHLLGRGAGGLFRRPRGAAGRRTGRRCPARSTWSTTYGPTCDGKSKSAMTAWTKDFSDTYHARTEKYPTIYTSTRWWSQCVDGDFSSTNPLWVARYASGGGTLPYNWSVYTFWQYSSSPIDQDTFNGAYDRLTVLATNHD